MQVLPWERKGLKLGQKHIGHRGRDLTLLRAPLTLPEMQGDNSEDPASCP